MARGPTPRGRPNRPRSTPPRTTALVAGVLYLVTFLASIPAVFLMGPVLTDPTYVLERRCGHTR